MEYSYNLLILLLRARVKYIFDIKMCNIFIDNITSILVGFKIPDYAIIFIGG